MNKQKAIPLYEKETPYIHLFSLQKKVSFN